MSGSCTERSTCIVVQDIAGPCIGHFVEAYLNQVQVQTAIHANTALKYPWVGCRTRTYNLKRFGDSPTSMLPHLKALVTTGIRIWLFRSATVASYHGGFNLSYRCNH